MSTNAPATPDEMTLPKSPFPGLTFISHSTADQELALKLKADLDRRRCRTWIAQRNIPFGENWSSAIAQAIKECSRVLVIVSPASKLSPYVDIELNYALHLNKLIVPVLLKDGEIPIQAISSQAVDFTSYAEGLENLLRGYGQLRNKPRRLTPREKMLLAIFCLLLIAVVAAFFVQQKRPPGPSQTTVEFVEATENYIVLSATNTGGQRSSLRSYALEFSSDIPIHLAPLELADAEKASAKNIVEPGTSARIRLRAPSFVSRGPPKETIMTMLGPQAATLWVEVEESNNNLREIEIRVPVRSIREFINYKLRNARSL